MMPNSKLFVGPYYGEFGHEITFAGTARKRANDYEHVTVCTRRDRHPLWEDFATEFIPHDIECDGMCHKSTHSTVPPDEKVRSYVPDSGYDILPPREYFGRKPAEWHMFGKRQSCLDGCIVFHIRNRPHVASRNWPIRNWHCLARLLFQRGLAQRILCIGTRKHALTAEGCFDARGMDLQAQMDILASADLAVGPSSGPMHLASHCGCPHFVWVGGNAVEIRRTGGRYRKGWNPFATPVQVIENGSWQPTFNAVANGVMRFLDETRPARQQEMSA
jgi:hypothetical protein